MFDRNSVPTAAAKVVRVCGWRVRPWGSPADGRRGDQQGAATAWKRACARGRGSRESWGWPVRPTEIQFSAYLFPIQSSLFNLQMLQLMEINLTPKEIRSWPFLATCAPPPLVRDQRRRLGRLRLRRLGRLGLAHNNVIPET